MAYRRRQGYVGLVGVWRLAFGVWRLAFGVWRLALLWNSYKRQ
jgi:hypothetical protein